MSFAAIIVGGALAAAQATAQSPVSDAACRIETGPAAPRLAACSALIDGGMLPSRDLPEILYYRGVARLHNGEAVAAIADFTEAIRRNPQYTDAFVRRAASYASLGDSRAAADYEEAILLEPQRAWPYNSRGYDALRRRDFDSAIQDFDKAIAVDPKYTLALINRANAYRAKGDFVKALADLDQARAINPQDASIYLSRAALLTQQDKFVEAIASLRQGLLIAPRDTRFHVELADALFGQASYDEAFAVIKRGLEVEPLSAELYGVRARIHNYRRENAAALADISRAIELSPNNVGPLLDRSTYYYRLGEVEKALADIDSAAKINPREPGVQGAACMVRAISKTDIEGARGHCDRVVQLATGEARTAGLYYRGIVALHQSRNEEAWGDFDAAVKAGGRMAPFSYYGRGLAGLRLGRAEEGKADLAEAEKLTRGIASQFERLGLKP